MLHATFFAFIGILLSFVGEALLVLNLAIIFVHFRYGEIGNITLTSGLVEPFGSGWIKLSITFLIYVSGFVFLHYGRDEANRICRRVLNWTTVFNGIGTSLILLGSLWFFRNLGSGNIRWQDLGSYTDGQAVLISGILAGLGMQCFTYPKQIRSLYGGGQSIESEGVSRTISVKRLKEDHAEGVVWWPGRAMGVRMLMLSDSSVRALY